MTPELLASISGIVLSLLFSYVPGLSGWYEPKSAQQKSLIMLLLLFLVTVAVFGLACANVQLGFNVVCSADGAWALVKVFVTAMIANQSTYMISPKSSKTKK